MCTPSKNIYCEENNYFLNIFQNNFQSNFQNNFQNNLANHFLFQEFNEMFICPLEENKESQENKDELHFNPLNDSNEKTTNFKTNKNEYNLVKNITIPSSKNEPKNEANNDESLFDFFSYERIKEIFTKNEKFNFINQKFKNNKMMEIAEDKK